MMRIMSKIRLVKKQSNVMGLTLKKFDSGRNRSLNNDFDSIVLRKNFVQKDKSIGMVLRSVPKAESTLKLKIVDKKSKMKLVKVPKMKKHKRATGQKPLSVYHNGEYFLDYGDFSFSDDVGAPTDMGDIGD